MFLQIQNRLAILVEGQHDREHTATVSSWQLLSVEEETIVFSKL